MCHGVYTVEVINMAAALLPLCNLPHDHFRRAYDNLRGTHYDNRLRYVFFMMFVASVLVAAALAYKTASVKEKGHDTAE